MWSRGLAWIGVVAVLASEACGATIHFQDDVYDNGVVRYRVGALGPSFERVDVDDNDLAWHERSLGTIGIKSTCTEYEDVPPVALLNQLLFGMANRRYRVEETVTLDGRAARHVIADVELDGVPVSLDIYLLTKDGCVYDLTYSASRATFEQGRAQFESFVQRFAVLSTRSPSS
jgi:hypothetical protein